MPNKFSMNNNAFALRIAPLGTKTRGSLVLLFLKARLCFILLRKACRKALFWEACNLTKRSLKNITHPTLMGIKA